MNIIQLIASIAAVVIGYIIIKRRCACENCSKNVKKFDGAMERYGGRQKMCEENCFTSGYYDACMNSCLQSGKADYMETGNEYDVLGISQVDDLDRGYGYDTPNSWPADQYFGLRGETPGK